MLRLRIFLVSSCFLVITSCVEIRDLGVPSWGLEGGEVELSCCFSLEEKSHYPELDVKWYHGSSPSPFLVWLPHLQETMQVVGETSLTSHLKVPTSQEQTCSSFRLSNLSLPLSGLFTCKVATFTQEAVASRRLTVVRKPRNFLLEVEETSGGLVAAVCRAEGGLPAPRVGLAACGRPLKALRDRRGLEARLSRRSIGNLCSSVACTLAWQGTNLSASIERPLSQPWRTAGAPQRSFSLFCLLPVFLFVNFA